MATAGAARAQQPSPPSPALVGNHFIKQYYGEVLPKKPLELHRFYHEQSTFCHATGNALEEAVTGLDNIKAKIQNLGLADATVDLNCGSVDAQPSHGGSA
jgi:Nuclear transport factor 2 (NTF2) domain